MGISNTGERILMDKETPLMIARHFSAYKFARSYLYNRKVLDIGCGEGYGSYYLAGFAKNVLGIDYDSAVINYASSKYQRDNLRFCAMDARNIASLGERFEGASSFQFIEHIPDAETILGNVKNLLDDGGAFICSTPNKRDASPKSDIPLNKFHIREYLLGEFKALLEAHFKKVEMFGLHRTRRLNFYRRLKKAGIFNFLPPSVNPVKGFYNRIDCTAFIITKERLEAALDFIAVCIK